MTGGHCIVLMITLVSVDEALYARHCTVVHNIHSHVMFTPPVSGGAIRYYLCFIEEAVEVESGEVVCPRLQNWKSHLDPKLLRNRCVSCPLTWLFPWLFFSQLLPSGI